MCMKTGYQVFSMYNFCIILFVMKDEQTVLADTHEKYTVFINLLLLILLLSEHKHLV